MANLTPRFVDKSVLLDFIGMNPAVAKIFGFKGINEDECLVRDGMSEAETKDTVGHENQEYDLVSGGMSYWDAHSKLMKEHKGYKAMDIENLVKKLLTTQVEPVRDRVLQFVGSTETIDRDGEVIKASAWQTDRYMKNPVVQWAHDYQSPPVGKTLSISRKGTDTVFEVEFPPEDTYPFADTVYKLCKGGYLNATSVGFIPIEFDRGSKDSEPKKTYTKVELLELSIVPVPSNPDALVSARNAGIITIKDFELITKPEETENYIRIPNPKDKGSHDGHRIRTIDISEKEGIKALYCGECKVIITYLFAKDHDWTMEKAKKWVDEHNKGVSQAEIADELAYLIVISTDTTPDAEN